MLNVYKDPVTNHVAPDVGLGGVHGVHLDVVIVVQLVSPDHLGQDVAVCPEAGEEDLGVDDVALVVLVETDGGHLGPAVPAGLSQLLLDDIMSSSDCPQLDGVLARIRVSQQDRVREGGHPFSKC